MKDFLSAFMKLSWLGWAQSGVALASKGPLPLEVLVAEVTGETAPAFALSLGSPDRFRKVTAQVMRPTGEILGYIKLPLTEGATERVRHEAARLASLWGFADLRRHIPRVLHAGEWGDSYILFQSSGPAGSGPTEFGRAHEEFLLALRSAHQVEKPGSVLVEEAARSWRQLQPLLNSEWTELGEKALERARQALTGRKVSCGISHGDFAPWNTRMEDGRLFVYDWESAAWEAPLEWDRIHFHVQVSSLLGRTNGWVGHFERTPKEKAVFLLYLLNSLRPILKEGAALKYERAKFRKQLLAAVLR